MSLIGQSDGAANAATENRDPTTGSLRIANYK